MLEVGCKAGPGGGSDSGLTLSETRSHFGGWAIVSSPLTLSHDVNNDTVRGAGARRGRVGMCAGRAYAGALIVGG